MSKLEAGARLATLAAISLCGSLALSSSHAALGAEAKKSGHYITQISMVSGKFGMFLSPNAVKLTKLGSGIDLISTAPKWEILIVNRPEKRYFVAPAKTFRYNLANTLTLTFGESLKHLPWKISPGKDICGMKTKHYEVVVHGGEALGENAERQTDLWVAAEKLVPADIANVGSRVLGVPEVGAWPIDGKFIEPDKTVRPALKIVSIKSATADAAEFVVPKEFVKTRRQEEAFMTSQSQDAIENMVKDLGSTDSIIGK